MSRRPDASDDVLDVRTPQRHGRARRSIQPIDFGEALVRRFDFPFIKTELLVVNPMQYVDRRSTWRSLADRGQPLFGRHDRRPSVPSMTTRLGAVSRLDLVARAGGRAPALVPTLNGSTPSTVRPRRNAPRTSPSRFKPIGWTWPMAHYGRRTPSSPENRLPGSGTNFSYPDRERSRRPWPDIAFFVGSAKARAITSRAVP